MTNHPRSHGAKCSNRVKISVSAKNIRNGKKDCPWACPIALAMQEAGIANPTVDCESWGSDETLGGYFSKRAARFIERFDAGKEVEPFTFVIEKKPATWVDYANQKEIGR